MRSGSYYLSSCILNLIWLLYQLTLMCCFLLLGIVSCILKTSNSSLILHARLWWNRLLKTLHEFALRSFLLLLFLVFCWRVSRRWVKALIFFLVSSDCKSILWSGGCWHFLYLNMSILFHFFIVLILFIFFFFDLVNKILSLRVLAFILLNQISNLITRRHIFCKIAISVLNGQVYSLE